MRASLHYTLIACFSLLPTMLFWSDAQSSISVSQSIDRTEMAYEDTAAFRVVVTWDGPAHAYRFEKPFRVQSDKLKVARYTSSVRSNGVGPSEITTKVFEYQLAPFLSGVATVQPMVIEYVTWPDSTVGQLVTDAVTLTVAEPVPADERRGGGFSGGLIAIIIVVVVGLGVGGYSLFKQKPQKEVIKNPAEVFLDQLAAMRKDSGMDLKKFQTGLYRILEVYIHSRYGLDITGKPASAIADELDNVEPDQTVRAALAGWMARAEREKFSPVEIAPGEVPRLESEVRAFFEKLK